MDEELNDANLDASTEEAFLASRQERETEEAQEAEVETPEVVAEDKPTEAEPAKTDETEAARAAELEAQYPQLVARLREAGVTEEQMLAEVDAKVAELQQATAHKELEEQLVDVRADLLKQVESGELTQAAAERLWKAEWNAAALARENELLRTRDASTAAEKAVERVQAEFPNAPLATLRKLATRGWTEAELKEFASEQDGAVQAAIAKQTALKESDKVRAHVPNRGLPGRSSTPTVSHEDSFEDIFASRNKG